MYQYEQSNAYQPSTKQASCSNQSNYSNGDTQPNNYSEIQVRTFSKSSAIQLTLKKSRQGIPTIYVEHAPVIVNGRDKRGDWTNKIIFMVDFEVELLQAIHFLNGKMQSDRISFDFHGSQSNKSLALAKNQDGTVMIRTSEGQKNQNIVVQPTVITQILTLLYKAYAERFGLTVVDAVSLLNVAPVSQAPKSRSQS